MDMKRKETGKNMIGNKKAIWSVFMAVVLMFGCMGCSSGTISAEEGKNTVVMTLNDYDVTLSEYNLFLIQYLSMQAMDADKITDELITTTKSNVASEIKLEIVEYLLAQETEGVELSDEETANIETNTDNYMNQYGEDFLAEYGIDRDAVKQLFTEQAYIQAIINKAKEDMAQDAYEENVEKFDGINFHTMHYALFPSIEYDESGNPVVDDNGANVDLSQEELKKQKEKAEELQKRAKDGEKLEDLIEEYGITASSGEERNYEGAYTDELNKVVENMKEGDISEVVETDAGYMVVRMDNTNDTDYKEYALRSAAMQYASNTITTLQQNWVSASGCADVEPDEAALKKVDIKKMCKKLQEKGIY